MLKRSLTIAGHRTSVALEAAFWHELERIATRRGVSLSNLIGDVDRGRDGGLASALRLRVVEELRRQRGADD